MIDAEVPMVLGTLYLARHRSRLQAYNMLQMQLMERFIRRGGTAEAWCAHYASAFRQRYGWMVED